MGPLGSLFGSGVQKNTISQETPVDLNSAITGTTQLNPKMGKTCYSCLGGGCDSCSGSSGTCSVDINEYNLCEVVHNAPAIRAAANMSNSLLWLGGVEFEPINSTEDSAERSAEIDRANELGEEWLQYENGMGVTNKNVLMESTLESQLYGGSLVLMYNKEDINDMRLQLAPLNKYDKV